MPLKTKVKVGNITNLSEARYCAGMGVDILSFPIGNQPPCISVEKFKEIAEWVVGPQFALEYSDLVDEQILNEVTQLTSIQFLQVNLGQIDILKQKGYTGQFILTLTEKDLKQITPASLQKVSLIIANTSQSNWAAWEELNTKVPILIDLSAEAHDLELILKSSLSGIALRGSEELVAGNKSYDHLADVLELLDVD